MPKTRVYEKKSHQTGSPNEARAGGGNRCRVGGVALDAVAAVLVVFCRALQEHVALILDITHELAGDVSLPSIVPTFFIARLIECLPSIVPAFFIARLIECLPSLLRT